MQSDMIERRNPLCSLWIKPQTCGFQDFLFLLQLDRLQLTAVCCNRWEGVKTTPQKDPFSPCESLQGIRVQVKN